MHVNQGNNVALDEEAIRTLVYAPLPPPPPPDPFTQELLNQLCIMHWLFWSKGTKQSMTQSLPLRSGISIMQTLTAVALFLRFLHLRGLPLHTKNVEAILSRHVKKKIFREGARFLHRLKRAESFCVI